MKKEDLTKQIQENGHSKVIIAKLDESRVDNDANGKPFYERNRLLIIMKGRLRGCNQNDKENMMVPFLEKAITDLNELNEETPIYYWEAIIDGTKRAGRSTKEKVLHIYPNALNQAKCVDK